MLVRIVKHRTKEWSTWYTVHMSMNEEQKKELEKKLTPEQYEIVVNKGTEHPGTGEYLHHKEDGTYTCISCDAVLFSSDTKYDSGSGWPSFTDVAQEGTVTLTEDTSHGMLRTEATCTNCGAHLGHVFPDGPRENTDGTPASGQRFCINSASLDFEKS